MNPAAILSVTSDSAGDFTPQAHGLGRVPLAAIPIPNSSGLMRLTPALYDATYVFLNASASGVTAFVVLF